MQKQFFQMSSIVMDHTLVPMDLTAWLIVTEQERLPALDFNLMKQRMACPLLVDFSNIYSSDEMERHASCTWELEEKMPSMLCGFERARSRSGDRNLLSEEGIQRSGGLTT
jgi:hypothetical protein